MVEQIRISPEEVRGYGNVCEEHSLDDFTVNVSSLSKVSETVHGALTNTYKLLYSVYGLMFDFDKGAKQLYLQTNEADTLSLGFDTVNKQLYLVDENDTGFSLDFDEDTNELYITDDAPPIVHNYSLALDQSSYTTTGSLSVSATLLDDGVPVSGATVSFTGGVSTVTATTDSSGVATATVTFSASGTLTATYSNVSDTATVTVQTYIFYDDASTNNRDTLFGASSISLRNNGTSTATWNSASPSYYQVKVTRSSSESFIEYLPMRGITDSFKLTIKYKLPSTSGVCNVGLYYYIDSNNWGGVKGLNDAQWISTKTSGTFAEQEYRTGQSVNTNYFTHEIVYNKNANTLTISTYDNSSTLIQTKTLTIPITLTSSVKWGTGSTWSNGDKNNIYEIKAEYI